MIPKPLKSMKLKIPKSWILLAVFIGSSIVAGAWIFTTPPNGLTNQTGSFFGNTSNNANNYTADNFITNNGGSIISSSLKGTSNGTKAITVVGGNSINLSGTGYPGGDGSGNQGALILRGSNSTDSDAQLTFQNANQTGYGIITWKTNASGNPNQWDMIDQVHHLEYTDFTNIHDHKSLYSRAVDFTSLKIFNIPFNISVPSYYWDVQIPLVVSDSENTTVPPYIKVREHNISLYSKQVNSTLRPESLVIFGKNISNPDTQAGVVAINTNTSLTTDTVYTSYNTGRTRMGYNGTRTAAYIGTGDSKPIVFDTKGTERQRIDGSGTISFPNSNLTIPTCINPTDALAVVGNVCINSSSNAINVYSGGAWRWANGSVIN